MVFNGGYQNHILVNTSIVNNYFITLFVFSLDNCGNNRQHQTPLIYKAHTDVGICLCSGFMVQSTQWGHVEQSQFT